MNYEKIYQNLVNKGRERQRGKNRETLGKYVGRLEQHHVIPRCMGGSDDLDNLVLFTPEEHLIAHLLLVRIYPNNQKILFAANWMTNRVKNNKEYGWVKKRHSDIMRVRFLGKSRSDESIQKQKETIKHKYDSGYISPRTGKSLTKEHKDAIALGNKGKVVPKESLTNLEGYTTRYGESLGKEKYLEKNLKLDSNSLKFYISKFGGQLGPVLFEENRKLKSAQNSGERNGFFGKTHSRESIQKISASNTGKPKYRSDEHNKKIGDSNRGKTQVVVTCPHCRKEGGQSVMKQWHFDNCKKNPNGSPNGRKMKPT